MNAGKILMWGEFPPNTHTGISVSNDLIYETLKTENKQALRIEEYTWNNNSFDKIRNLFKNYIQILRVILTDKIKILYFNLPLSKIGIFKIIFILLWVKLFSYKTICKGHMHRGDFKDFIDYSIYNRIILSVTFYLINELVVLSPVYKKEVNDFYKTIKVDVLHNTSDFESDINSYQNEYNGNYLCLSNYIKSKGLKEIVESFKSPYLSKLNLTINGQVYDVSFFEELKKLASKNVILNDGLSREEIANVLKKYDCLIIPSWNEGQPIIILEAMSLGIPIIATKVGDIPNMLGENYGFFAEPQNIDSLLQAIVKFNDKVKKEEISNYLYKRYFSLYSNNSYKRKLLEIFNV